MRADLEKAEAELSVLLNQHPDHAAGLRYRADVHLRQARLVAAKSDIDASLRADPTSVETALLRGHINEAIRLAEIDAILAGDMDPETTAETPANE
jgi:predicted Zn-dependent protease